MKVERRAIQNIELQESSDPAKMPTLRGYAAPFNELSQYPIAGSFYEKIDQGSFQRALKDPGTDVLAVVNHNSDALPLARFTGGKGTLSLYEDQRGLRYEFQPANTQMGRDVVESVRAGNVSGMSFAFRARKEKWDGQHQGLPVRTLQDVDIFDICIANTPYYAGTSINMRGKSSNEMTEEEYKSLAKPHAEIAAAERARTLRLIELQMELDNE